MVTKSDTPLQTEAPEVKTADPGALPDQKTDTPEPDWKVEAASARAQVAKLENDLKALKGLQGKNSNRDALMQEIKDDIAEVRASNKALFKAMAEGNTENLPQEAARIANEGAQSRANRSFQAQHASLLEQLQEAVQDDDGKPVIDVFTAPELEDDRQSLAQLRRDIEAGKASQSEYLGELAGIIARAGKIANRKITADRVKAETRKVEDRANKKITEKGGVLDLDTGPGAGAAGPKTLDQLTNVDTRFGRMSPTQRREHREALDAALSKQR